MGAVLKLPCQHEAFYLARRVLRREDATSAELTLALDVLQASHDWLDIQLCQQVRKTLDLAARDAAACPANLPHGFMPLKSQAEIEAEELQDFIERAQAWASHAVLSAAVVLGAAFAFGQLLRAGGW